MHFFPTISINLDGFYFKVISHLDQWPLE